MADTIITNTPDTKDGGAASWVVAIVIIAAVAIGGYFLYQNGVFQGERAGDNTNINITTPAPEVPVVPPAE